MEKPVIIFGAGGLGKVALDIFNQNKVDVLCFLDDKDSLQGVEIENVTVMGTTDDDKYLSVLSETCEACVALDETTLRENLVEELKARKVMPVNVIHPKSYIAESAHIGHGNLIQIGSSINSFAKVGNHCVVHANAVIDFQAEIGDFVQIGAGAIINSEAVIGKGAFIGSGAILVSGVTIGENARVGAGSVVISPVAANETVFGNPAQKISK